MCCFRTLPLRCLPCCKLRREAVWNQPIQVIKRVIMTIKLVLDLPLGSLWKKRNPFVMQVRAHCQMYCFNLANCRASKVNKTPMLLGKLLVVSLRRRSWLNETCAELVAVVLLLLNLQQSNFQTHKEIRMFVQNKTERGLTYSATSQQLYDSSSGREHAL